MKATFSQKLGMERCLSCEHRWIDYAGLRGTCYMCGSTNISECVSLTELRETITGLRKKDKKYIDKQAKRTTILKQLYREVAELSLKRAQEIYTKVRELYSKGDLSDRVLDQLIMAFRLFSELGVHTSAGAIATLIATGYAQRGTEKDISTVDDLSDLIEARQWFMRLGAKEWETSLNLRIGEKAMAAVNTDPAVLQSMTQISIWHLYKAREHYFEQRSGKMLDRVEFDIKHATSLLTTHSQNVAQIESARLNAESNVRYSENLRHGLESLGESVHHGLRQLGEHIETYGGEVGRALQASSQALSSNVMNAMYTVSGTSRLRGFSLDKRMAEVGKMISTTARELPEGFFKPIKELGAKFALGTGSRENEPSITEDQSVVKIAETVIPESKKTEEALRSSGEPAIKLTGTLLDTLLTKGMSKIVEELETTEKQK